MIEKYLVDPKKAEIEAQKSQARQDDLLLSNLKYKLLGELRTLGAIKVDIFAFHKGENEIKANAKFNLNGYKQTEFVFKKNHLGNFVLKNLEASLDNAELIQMKDMPEFTPSQLECNMTFDLSQIQAKNKGNVYDIFYPTTGYLGTITSAETNVESIKKLCVLAADNFGLKPDFVNELKINNINEDIDLVEAKSDDLILESMKEMKSFVAGNNAEKERDKFSTLRSNLIKSLELKAQDIVKKSTGGYKNGITKIVSTNTICEYVDNKFVGQVIVDARVGGHIKTYALPVAKNVIVANKPIDTYLVKQELYKEELDKKIVEDIKAGLDNDMLVLEADMLEEATLGHMINNTIKAARASEIQKSFKMDKHSLPGELGIGDIFVGESGLKYEIRGNEGDAVYTLVLVD